MCVGLTWRALSVVVITLTVGCNRDVQALTRKHLTAGDKYFAQKQYGEALIEYRHAVRADEMSGEARQKLARAYEAAADGRNALRQFVRAADLLPTDTAVQLDAAKRLLAAGQFEDATARLNKVVDAEPKNIEALVLRGSALVGLRDIEGAVRQVEQALALDPQRGLTHASVAVLRLANGETEAARISFERAVRLDPESVPALFALATFQWAADQPAAAEEILRRILHVDRSYVPARQLLGVLYLTTGRHDEAEEHVKAVAEISGTLAARVALADYYRATNRSDEARRVLEGITPDRETSARVQVRLAQIAYDAGQVTRAHAIVEQVLRQEPRNESGLLLKARWLLQEGKHADANATASAAVQAHADSAAAHYTLGLVQAVQRDKDAAAKSFRQVLRLNPSATIAQLQLSQLELARGETGEAVALAEGALKNAPRNADARLSAAKAFVARGDLDRAEPLVLELLSQYPDAAAAHAVDGALRLAMRDVNGARRSFTRALELDVRSIEALAGLTVIDVREQRLAEARGRIQTRLVEEPTRVPLLTLAAQLAIRAGDTAKAEQTLRRVIELAPVDTDAYALLAQLYLAQHKLDDARAEFDRLAGRHPRDISSRTMAAMIVYAQNDLADAKRRYEAILALDPNAFVAANNLAWIYAEEKKNLDRALRLAKNAVRTVPESAQAHDTLGWIHYRMKVPELAIASLERAVSLDPENAMPLYRLGLAYAEAGEVAKARRAMTRVLELQPQGKDADDARQALKRLGTDAR